MLNVERSAPRGAVFLSYASQDAEAAKDICAALRAAGVEVWFDKNELVGGDAWDAKIRGQISSCALFLPVISASTQARREGYFRLEWKLAAQRTHMMSERTAYLLPVVIDATRDAEADVPGEFKAVQWTRLPGGETPAAFSARVKNLLAGGAAHASPPAVRPDAGGTPARHPAAAATRRRWLVPALAGLSSIVTLTIWQPWRSLPATPGAHPAAPLSEARQLTLKARALIDDDLMAVRENFRLADELCQQAVGLDSMDGEAWATWARVSSKMIQQQYDRTPQRMEAARRQAERAIRLAPNSVEARLAMAAYFAVTLETAEAERRLRDLLKQAPTDARVALDLAQVLDWLGRAAEASDLRLRHAAFAENDPRPLLQEARALSWKGRFVEAEALVDRAHALAPTWASYGAKLRLESIYWGDLGAAKQTLDQAPPGYLLEGDPALLAAQIWLWRGEPEKALDVLRRIPNDFFEEANVMRPKGFYSGWAHQIAGRPTAAEAEWSQALAAVVRRLAAEPNDAQLLKHQALLLALTGQKEEAEKVHRLGEEIGYVRVGLAGTVASLQVSWNALEARHAAAFFLAVDNREEAIRVLQGAEMPQGAARALHLNNLRYDPWFEPIRKDPRIQKIIAEGEAWLNELRRAGATPAGAKPAAAAVPVVPAPDAKSVAVLPFANLSGDKDQEYFSDGLTEEILNALARERDLRVPGRSSSFSFKGKNASAAEIAKALNVSRLVEGSVRKSGNKVRISVSLTRASDGFSEELGTFTEELTDIFALQDKVARVVVEKLTQRSGTKAVASLTNNPEAYDAYLRGRALQTRAAGFRYQAAAEYERAVALDPQFALAWARLAEARFRDYRAFFDWRPAVVAATRTAIDQALATQPDLPEALIARAEWHRLVTCDYAAAQRDLDRAEELQPATSELRHAQGLLALDRGDEALAKRQLRAAMEMDPENGDRANSIGNAFNSLGEMPAADELYARAMRIQGPGHLIPVFNRVNLRARWRGPEAALRLLDHAPAGQRGIDEVATNLLLQLGRDAEAAERARRISIDQFAPGDFQIYQDAEGIALLLTVAGDTNRARALWQQLREAAGKEIAAGDLAPRIRKTLVRAEAALGQRGAAQAALEEWRKSAAAVPSANRRLVEFQRQAVDCYADLGMKDEAIALLREIENSTFGYGFSLCGNPSFRPLHGDPRFEELVRRAEAAAKAQPDP